MSYLRVEGLTYTQTEEQVHDVDLAIEDGEMLALMGATGAGKTSLLRCIAGLSKPESGRIMLDGREITQLRTEQRDVAVVFPSYSLYFHMSVRDNIAFPLRMRKESRGLIDQRVAEASQMLGISHLLKRRLTQISGGERQRVSIGRAIVRRPKLFLFDEPFMSLDLKLREQLRVELKLIQEKLETAAIFVTSDPAEALTMGDRVASIDRGRILQVDDPRELYENPAALTVGNQMTVPRLNVLEVPLSYLRARQGRIDLSGCAEAAEAADGEPSTLIAFRPEEAHRVLPGAGIAGRVRLVENLGNVRLVHCALRSGGQIVYHDRGEAPAVGATVAVDVPADRLMFFDPTDGKRSAVPVAG